MIIIVRITSSFIFFSPVNDTLTANVKPPWESSFRVKNDEAICVYIYVNISMISISGGLYIGDIGVGYIGII